MTLSGIWYSLVGIYSFAIFVYVVMSWIPNLGPLFGVYRFLAAICEPYIGLFRRVLPTAWMGSTGIDFSPMVAWAVLAFVVRPVGSVILSQVGL